MKKKRKKETKKFTSHTVYKIRDHIVFHYVVIVSTCKELKKKKKNAVNGKKYLFSNM